MTPVDVLYIVGMNRSGSTVLERVLASHDRTVTIGEAATLWLWGIDERLCSCRRPITECELWRPVFAGAFDDEPIGSSLARYINRARYVPMVHHAVLRSPRFRRDLTAGLAAVGRLYQAVARTAPDRVIIDSSKYPLYGHLLSLVPGLRIAYVHLVRDSRAVAYSFGKQRLRPEIHWRQMEMTRARPAKSALVWNVRFAASEALRLYRMRVVQLRYEDFVADPKRAAAVIDGLLRDAGMRTLGDAGEDASAPWYHSVQGNPMRFEQRLEIRPDDEWRREMPSRDRLVVAALTAPFLALHKAGVGFR